MRVENEERHPFEEKDMSQERQMSFYKKVLEYQQTDAYRRSREEYYQNILDNYLQNISISMFSFIFSLLLTGIFGKVKAKFLETICFSVVVFSFFYFFYLIYKCIRLCCKGKV
jgi:hypothetical protein